MSNQDLELGLQSPGFIEWKDNQQEEDVSPIESSCHPLESIHLEPSITKVLHETKSEEKAELAQDDYIAGVPRKKVEQLMKLWIEVLRGSLANKDDSDDGRRMSMIHAGVGHLPMRDPDSLRNLWSIQRPQPLKVIVGDLEVWSETDISSDDERRRAGRQEWRTSEDNLCLEDCWKHLWQPKPGVDKGLFQWSCSDARRQELQLSLADALNANSSIIVVGLYMRRDFRAIAPWISQMGLRLNELYRTIYQGAGISPMTQIEILIECIWCCNSFRTELGVKRNNQSPRIGDVLSACYRRRILKAPTKNPLMDSIILREHYQHVRTAIYLVTLLYKHQLPTIHRSEDLKATWETSLSAAEATMREYPKYSGTEGGQDSFFRVDDFNIRDLQSLGHLQLQWTSYWDEHLKLETSSTANVIKVYWFQPSLAQFLVQNRLCTQITYGERERREKEISATWSIIFTSNSSEKEAQKRYHKLMAPPWLSLLAHNSLRTWDSEQEAHEAPGPQMSRFFDAPLSSKYCFEAPDHLRLRWSKNQKPTYERMSYSQFPIYEDRLRELRSYMDSQQPTGLGALWKDRRNSNTYYTFWFVTIFGCLSVFLATCGLAVSIAQTWAQFQSLPTPSP